MLKNSVWWLRVLSVVEGLSWVVLFLVAVPLKYLADNPVLVKLMGPIHGALFTAFLVALALAWKRREWSLGRPVFIFLLSLVPFGWLFTDGFLKREVVLSA